MGKNSLNLVTLSVNGIFERRQRVELTKHLLCFLTC
jgi:hypothetical protein